MLWQFVQLGAAFVGTGLVFWVSDIVLHLLAGEDFHVYYLLAFNIIPPLVTCAVVPAVSWHATHRCLRHCLAGVLGIWVTGPLLMMIGWSFLSPDLELHVALFVGLMLTVAFPITCFSMATYDASLLGLLFTTIALPLIGLMYSKLAPRILRR